MEHKKLECCPICNSSQQKTKMIVRDHMITQEEFELTSCGECGFLFTNPIPNEDKIGNYYKSEEYISHSSNKKGVINKLYNLVRSYTLNQKTKLLGKLSVGKELLDIGAGTGHFLNACRVKGYNVLGLEPDDQARMFAKENFDLELKALDYLGQVEANSKDLITMWHVLEHVYHLQRDAHKIVDCLKEDGKWIIAVPNHESFDAQYYGVNWAAYDVPRHLYHFRKRDIENLAESCGMKLEKVLPMKFDSFYVSMLSEKYIKGSFFKALMVGWKSNLKAKKYGYSSQIYVLAKKN